MIDDENSCVNCGAQIRLLRYATEYKFMHVDPSASFPNERKGTAWWHCRMNKVAEPKPEAHRG